MTKHEIIDEIAGLYNSGNRSVHLVDGTNEESGCLYAGEGEKICAFAYMVKPERRVDLVEWTGASSYITNDHDILQEKYRGHAPEFYDQIQGLHDIINNWNETGLSSIGKLAVERLKEVWKD